MPQGAKGTTPCRNASHGRGQQVLLRRRPSVVRIRLRSKRLKKRGAATGVSREHPLHNELRVTKCAGAEYWYSLHPISVPWPARHDRLFNAPQLGAYLLGVVLMAAALVLQREGMRAWCSEYAFPAGRPPRNRTARYEMCWCIVCA
jgi:hypothetical protein